MGNDLTEGLRKRPIPRLTGGPVDKKLLNVSNFNIAGVFTQENMRKA